MLDGTGLRRGSRLLGHADLEEAARLVPAWLSLPPAVRAAVPAVWTRWLGHPGFNADLIEDLNRPVGQRVTGLGVAMALDGHWARLLRDDPRPSPRRCSTPRCTKAASSRRATRSRRG